MDAILPLLLLVVAVLAVVRASRIARRVVVYEYERGLRYAGGRFTGVVGPGLYWDVGHWSETRKVDVRPMVVPVPGQEVLTSDGVALKVSLAASYEVADPAVAVNKVESYRDALHVELQLALRQIVGGTSIDEVLASRQTMGKALHDLTADRIAALGLRLLRVDVRDVMFPGELKRVFSQVARARQEGLAALERARGETAALRSLANAAQLVDRNPHLLQLRLLQVLGQQPGNTVVLGVPPASGPIPIRASGDAGPRTPDQVSGAGDAE